MMKRFVIQINKRIELVQLYNPQKHSFSELTFEAYFSTRIQVVHFVFVTTNNGMLSPDNFVQEATSTQSYNRLAYAYNNPLKYTDPSGEWFGADDAIVAGAGFVIGVGTYLLTQEVSKFTWTDVGKAALTGLSVAAIAEAGYLTLGGGLIATEGAVGAAAGGMGSVNAAVGFAGSFSMNYVSNVIGDRQNFAQVKDAYSQGGEWSGLGLVSLYATGASLSAGLSRNPGLGKIKIFGEVINAQNVLGYTADKGLTTLAQKVYDADTHSWSLSGEDWKETGLETLSAFISSYSGEQVVKWSGLSGIHEKFEKALKSNLWREYTKKITLSVLEYGWNKDNSWYNTQTREAIFEDLYSPRTFFSTIGGAVYYVESLKDINIGKLKNLNLSKIF